MYFLVFKVDNLYFQTEGRYCVFSERMEVKPGCYLSLLFYGDLFILVWLLELRGVKSS